MTHTHTWSYMIHIWFCLNSFDCPLVLVTCYTSTFSMNRSENVFIVQFFNVIIISVQISELVATRTALQLQFNEHLRRPVTGFPFKFLIVAKSILYVCTIRTDSIRTGLSRKITVVSVLRGDRMIWRESTICAQRRRVAFVVLTQALSSNGVYKHKGAKSEGCPSCGRFEGLMRHRSTAN